jgi:predicted DNA-binding protein
MSDDVLIDAGPLVALIRYTKLMAMLSIRLDARTASTVDRVAAQTGKTKSEIAREALAKYAEEVDKLLGEKVDKKSAGERPFDKAKHLIGACDSGGMQLSTRTGEKFTEMLLRERDERRRADRRRPARRADR